MAGSGSLDYNDVLQGLNIRYLTASGLWNLLNEYRQTGRRNFVFNVFAVVLVIAYIPLLAATIAGAILIEKDLEGITLILLNPITQMQTALKFFVLWSGIEIQSRLLDLMKKDFLTCIPADKRVQCDEIVQKFVIRTNFLLKVGFTMNSMTLAVWDLLPILRSEFFRETLGITIFGTPKGPNKILANVYPFIDFDQPYRTQAVYCYEMCLSCFAAFMITVCEALLVQLLALLVAHLKVIVFLMSELKCAGNQKGDTEQLLSNVREHQKLLKFGDDIQTLNNSVITLQLSTGLLILILAIFNASLGSDEGDVVEMMKFASYALYSLVEVYLYCYLGELLETTSEEISFAAYCSEWYAMTVEFRKILIMTMVRSQRPVTLMAGKVVPVNMEAFKNIIQTAYSTSMLMLRVTTG